MLLKDFISHIKHNSVCIELIDNDNYSTIWSGDIGSYNHWIHKTEHQDKTIDTITFNFNDVMCIYLVGDEDVL